MTKPLIARAIARQWVILETENSISMIRLEGREEVGPPGRGTHQKSIN